jgi:hypothetical protein
MYQVIITKTFLKILARKCKFDKNWGETVFNSVVSLKLDELQQDTIMRAFSCYSVAEPHHFYSTLCNFNSALCNIALTSFYLTIDGILKYYF